MTDLPSRDLVRVVDWRAVVDGLHEAVIAADETNRVVYANRVAEALLGWAAEHLLGQPITTIIPERFRERHQRGFERYLERREPTVLGRPMRVPALRADGTEVEIELVLSAADTDEGPILIGLLRDLSGLLELEGAGDLADVLVSAFAEAPTLADAVPRVLAGLGESLNWDLVQLWLTDDDTSVLRRHATWMREGVSADVFVGAARATFGRGVGLPGAVWASGEPAWIADIGEEPSHPRSAAARGAGLRGAFAFPMRARDRVVGVVEMLSRQPHGISADLSRRMSALGALLGEFIERRVAEEDRIALLESERAALAEAERARAQLAFLMEASTALSGSLDLEVTLEQVASLAVPALGDWCMIHLVTGDELALAAVAHDDEAKVRTIREIQERHPAHLAGQGVGRVIRTGTVVRHERVTDDVLHAIAHDDHHLAMMRSLELGSLVMIPMHARHERVGAITVATNRGRALDDETVDTAVELARRAATAIDSARLFRDLQLQTAVLRSRGEAGIEGQLVIGPNGGVISYNRRYSEMWSVPTEALRAGSDAAVLENAMRQVVDPVAFRERVDRLYANREYGREEIALKDGRVFDRVGAPLIEGGVYLGYAWYFRDVTSHKRIQADLSEAAARSAALARTLQQSLLPPSLPEIPGLEIGACYVPAASGIEVGGDFYDMFPLGRDSWGLVVGDVCGHGAEAAAVTAFARYTLRAASAQTRSPAHALRLLNAAMLRQDADALTRRFVTVVNARVTVRPGSALVTLSVGGHPLPVVRQADGTARLAGRAGTLLGIVERVAVHDARLELRSGECIVMVTDGVLEARRGREQFGAERLVELVREEGHRSPAELADVITRAAGEHAGGDVTDDIAVVVIGVR